jgi:hypothetical protein
MSACIAGWARSGDPHDGPRLTAKPGGQDPLGGQGQRAHGGAALHRIAGTGDQPHHSEDHREREVDEVEWHGDRAYLHLGFRRGDPPGR